MNVVGLNILLVSNPSHHDYGISLLYDGLIKLGHKVTDWPRNYFFHFEKLENCDMDCKNGPCAIEGKTGCLQHPAALTYSKEISHLETKPDLIITNNGWGYEWLYQKYKEVPVAVLDLGDSQHSYYNEWFKCLGKHPEGYFRREFLVGQTGFPLSYSYYSNKSIFKSVKEMQYNVSCMFRPTNPVRQQIVQSLSEISNVLVATLPHQQYLDALSRSRFAVALPGAGQDTLRYWEIAGRGSVIISPAFREIFINNDFVDGINCIKFTDYKDLVTKVNFYLNNPQEYAKLRLASWAHFHAYHTTESRALELLNRMGF